MNLFSLALFIHILATLGLFAGLAIEWLILVALRRAATPRDAGTWTQLWPKLMPLNIASAALLIISGIYLAAKSEDWGEGWIRVSLVALFLIAPLGAIAGRQVRAIHGESGIALLGLLVSCRTMLALGVVMLMTIKPDLTESVLVLVTALAGGLAYGFGSRNRHRAVPKYTTEP